MDSQGARCVLPFASLFSFRAVCRALPQPGEIVLLYGTGFGPVNPPIPAGRLFDTPNQMTAPVRVRFGDTWVEALGGLASPGLYQIAVQAPDSAPDGDHEVVAEVANKPSLVTRIPVRRGEPPL